MTGAETQWGPAAMLAGLREAGYTVHETNGFAVFDYDIEVGPRLGQSIKVGLQLIEDWPLSAPGGPQVSPPLGHPHGAVHPSPLGAGWEYWSRPAAQWASDRSVRGYLRHLRTLFAQLHAEAAA